MSASPGAPGPAAAEMALRGSGRRKHSRYLPTRGRVPRRTAVLALGVGAMFAAAVLLGSYTVTVPDFFAVLGAHLAGGPKIPVVSFMVMEHKLPRAVTGGMVGAAFGLSGALFQTLLRNPLASPDVIGISYGASAAAVTAIVAFGASGAAVSGAALTGALAVAGLIYAVSRRGPFGSAAVRGAAAGNRLILAGVGIAAALQAMVSFLMTRADIRTAADALVWLNGSLNAASWDRAGVLALALLVLLPAAAALAGPLRILELGDDAAGGLGVRTGAARLGTVAVAVALAAAATAATGPVAFVAFLAGPISRRFVRRASLPAAALTGMLIVLGADFLAANLAPLMLGGTVLPVGVVTGALGAPFLLWLLATANRKQT